MNKILFLDINGVIEPLSNEKFDLTFDEFEKLNEKLEKEQGINYRKYSKYLIKSVCYYWDKEALKQLKRIVDKTGAKIVISSYWKLNGIQAMKDFLAIYNLGEYVVDVTPDVYRDKIDSKPYERIFKQPINDRSLEILEYLKTHDKIEDYIALDDRNLRPFLDGHFVQPYLVLTKKDADEAIYLLNRDIKKIAKNLI